MSSSTPFRLVMLSAAICAGTWVLASGETAQAQCACSRHGVDDGLSSLFGPPQYCGLPAPNYPVPYDAPDWVGEHQFTYPPMMPHHSLPHYRKVYSYRHGPGLSRTNVCWHVSYLHSAWDRLHHVFELPR